MIMALSIIRWNCVKSAEKGASHRQAITNKFLLRRGKMVKTLMFDLWKVSSISVLRIHCFTGDFGMIASNFFQWWFRARYSAHAIPRIGNNVQSSEWLLNEVRIQMLDTRLFWKQKSKYFSTRKNSHRLPYMEQKLSGKKHPGVDENMVCMVAWFRSSRICAHAHGPALMR